VKLLLLVLLAANLALYAWQQGAFGSLPESGREPERVARQVNPERIRVLTQPDVQRLKQEGSQIRKPAEAPPQAAADTAVCLEFGDFNTADSSRVLARLDKLGLGDRMSSRPVDAPGWYMVYIPPFKTRAEVERRADELRQAGVREMLVVADNSPMRFGIALGSFRDQELARNHAEDLARRGIKGVRVADRASASTAVRFRVRDVDPAVAQQLSTLAKDFPQGRLGPCAG
jgi:cell division protein FtsN